jgi:hypothetical protein
LLLAHGLDLSRRFDVDGEIDVTASSLGVMASPTLTLRAHPSAALTLSASVARRHQLQQSLRNEESLIGSVFPADLFVVAGSGGVPAARADEASIGFAYRPSPGLSLGAQAYARDLSSIVFVAPRSGAAFSDGSFAVGSASVEGVSADLSASGSRYGVILDYGYQRVRHQADDVRYVPSYAPEHRAQLGGVVHATPTLSLRLATTSAWGRRTTAVLGPLVWEACNLADAGCELAGAAEHGDALGRSRPPAYLRTDVGARKHWHVDLRGQDASLALYGTVTNVLNRRNTLNYAIDPATGAPASIDMLPISPLVIGFELVF